MKKICIIYNSKISLFNKFLLNKIIKILKKDNHVETFATERVGHATLLCKVHINKFDIIVAAGGDGTINEVINGMDDKKLLAIIPLGTANIGAYEANINKSSSNIAKIIQSGKIKKIHIQEANNRKFFLMTGVGYDASIV
jgi:diacylglycerol kinase (ATP)